MDNNIIQRIINCNYDEDKFEYSGIVHFRYDECNEADLITVDEENQVHKDLYKAFLTMQAAAKKDGADIFIISGFRSRAEQKIIFVRKFKDKVNPSEQEFVKRLKFSAPSSFSEHHTGLAVDVNSLFQNFAKTYEYKWLVENAEKYGFENSFPKNNKQGLGFEPWHWRYVGTDEAEKVFQKARKFQQ